MDESLEWSSDLQGPESSLDLSETGQKLRPMTAAISRRRKECLSRGLNRLRKNSSVFCWV